MSKSPGHQKYPDHEVRETKIDARLQVEIDGKVVADSDDVIRVDEDDHPPRHYFPREDVRMELFEPTDNETTCPFKGKGRHFTVEADGTTVRDAAWSYENPYDEHQALKDRMAFYVEEKDIELRRAS